MDLQLAGKILLEVLGLGIYLLGMKGKVEFGHKIRPNRSQPIEIGKTKRIALVTIGWVIFVIGFFI